MTSEQTLDWLAQQHWEQCHEDRPIQDWIRKMKSELPAQPAVPQPSHSDMTWVGLTKEEVSEIAAQGHQRWLEFYYAIEAKLKEKNFA